MRTRLVAALLPILFLAGCGQPPAPWAGSGGEVPGMEDGGVPGVPEPPEVDVPGVPGLPGVDLPGVPMSPPDSPPSAPPTAPEMGSPVPGAPAVPTPAPARPRAENASVSSPVDGTGEGACGPMTMFSLPASGGQPAGVAPDDDGSVWFTDPGTHSIGRLEPDGRVTRYRLRAGSLPRAIARGPAGDFWYTDQSGPSVGRITTGGVVTEFRLPTVDGNPMGSPSMGSAPMSITAGPDGAMWFTEAGADQVGRITADGVVTEFPLPRRDRMHAHPTAIAAGSDGAVWFSEPLMAMLARIDVETHEITEYRFRRNGGGAVGGNSLSADPAGTLWFEDPGSNAIGRMTTGGDVATFEVPATFGAPAGVAAGRQGDVWFFETFDGKIGRRAADGTFTGWTAPPEAKGIGHGSPTQLAVGSDGALWFAAPAANRIGRIPCA